MLRAVWLAPGEKALHACKGRLKCLSIEGYNMCICADPRWSAENKAAKHAPGFKVQGSGPTCNHLSTAPHLHPPVVEVGLCHGQHGLGRGEGA